MLITVGRYLDPWEAHIVCARLRADAVPATVAGDQHMIMNWPLCIALGGALIQVPDGFEQRAHEIIADYHAGVFEQTLDQICPVIEACPACGSTDIVGYITFPMRVLAVITTLAASAPFPARATRTRCRACGFDWPYG